MRASAFFYVVAGSLFTALLTVNERRPSKIYNKIKNDLNIERQTRQRLTFIGGDLHGKNFPSLPGWPLMNQQDT